MSTQNPHKPATAAPSSEPTPRTDDVEMIGLIERHYGPAPTTTERRRELDRQLWARIENRRRPLALPALALAATCALALALVTKPAIGPGPEAPVEIAAGPAPTIPATRAEPAAGSVAAPASREAPAAVAAATNAATAPRPAPADAGDQAAPVRMAAASAADGTGGPGDSNWLTEEWSYRAGATLTRIDGSLPEEYEAIAVAFLQY